MQFLPREVLEAAGRDGHHGVARLVAGGEGVDARLVVQHVHRRHGDARGQGHLFDHVQQPPFGQIGGLRIDRPAAEHQGDLLAAGRKLGDLVQAAQADDHERAQRDPGEERRIPQVRLGGRMGVDPCRSCSTLAVPSTTTR